MTKICNVEITHPDKIVFENGKITKLDIVKYYQKAYKKMKPFFENRLLSVIRFHSGKPSEKFFKKHPNPNENVEKVFFGAKKQQNCYFFLKNIEQFINQVQLGSIEFHAWNCLQNSINAPDILIFDLDPDEKLSLDVLRHGVLYLKEILQSLNLKSFLKTSGGKGYHIYVPLKDSKGFRSVNNFAKKCALLLEEKWSEVFTTSTLKVNRKHKIFVDYLRNKKGATCVMPYSVRIRKTATVSMPISWNDLEKFAPNAFDISLATKYLSKNPWKNFFTTHQSIK